MSMRAHAESHYQLSPSDKRLGKAVCGARGVKIGDVEGTAVPCASEEAIFAALGAC
jgi:hypothetical protein